MTALLAEDAVNPSMDGFSTAGTINARAIYCPCCRNFIIADPIPDTQFKMITNVIITKHFLKALDLKRGEKKKAQLRGGGAAPF